MIRYISGPKKSKVESQIRECDDRVTFSKVFMVFSAILLLLSQIVSFHFFDVMWITIFIVSLIVFVINADKLKKLEIELEEVADDIVKDPTVMTQDELMDDLIKSIIREQEESANK